MIPTLHTDRLTLRGPLLSDYPAFEAYWASDRCAYTGGRKAPPAAWDDFAAAFGLWLFYGYGCWSVEDRATGQFAGLMGINRPAHFPEAEIGWIFMPQAEGKGYARESGRAALDWIWANTTLPSLVSYIDPENSRSLRLATRLGAVNDPQAARPHREDLVYRHRRVA